MSNGQGEQMLAPMGVLLARRGKSRCMERALADLRERPLVVSAANALEQVFLDEMEYLAATRSKPCAEHSPSEKVHPRSPHQGPHKED